MARRPSVGHDDPPQPALTLNLNTRATSRRLAGALAVLIVASGGLKAAEPEAACRAQPVGDAKIMKSHEAGLGACFETDRGNDPYRFGRTTYRKQTIGWRDRQITLPDGGAGVEEYFCRLPIGILLQVYRCPCGIDVRVAGRGLCRTTPE